MFCITHIPREKNGRANALAQQASGYEITIGVFAIKGKPMLSGAHACDDESIRDGSMTGNAGAFKKPTSNRKEELVVDVNEENQVEPTPQDEGKVTQKTTSWLLIKNDSSSDWR
jgi:hypothetical protein